MSKNLKILVLNTEKTKYLLNNIIQRSFSVSSTKLNNLKYDVRVSKI